MKKQILKHFMDSKQESFTDVSWYQEANEYCSLVAKKYSIPLYKVVGVLAALSPKNKWIRNKEDVITMIEKGINGKYRTFHNNRDKAIKILSCAKKSEVEMLLSGRKIFSFYHNILNYSNSNLVTVDIWAGRSVGVATVTPRYYNEIEDAYIDAATDLGILPSELQAIVWTHIRGKVAQ